MGQQEGLNSRRHAAVAAAAIPTRAHDVTDAQHPVPRTITRVHVEQNPERHPTAAPARRPRADRKPRQRQHRLRRPLAARLLNTDRGAPLARSHRAKAAPRAGSPPPPGSVANLKRRPRGDSSSYGGNASPVADDVGDEPRDKFHPLALDSRLVPPPARRRNGVTVAPLAPPPASTAPRPRRRRPSTKPWRWSTLDWLTSSICALLASPMVGGERDCDSSSSRRLRGLVGSIGARPRVDEPTSTAPTAAVNHASTSSSPTVTRVSSPHRRTLTPAAPPFDPPASAISHRPSSGSPSTLTRITPASTSITGASFTRRGHVR